MDILKIETAWANFEKKRFPLGIRGKDLNGINLTIVQSRISKDILTVINLKKNLSPILKEELTREIKQLETALPCLTGEGEVYFKELYQIAKEVYDNY